MSSVNPENLLAVALVINRSRDGPAFVFHYPPDVRPVTGGGGDPDDSNGDLEDILRERMAQPNRLDMDGLDSHDEHQMTDSGTQIVPWERLAGFPTRDLAGILTPARAYHKKLFQLSLEPLYCVSYPIHVPESGKWKKAKKSKKVDDEAKDAPDSDPAQPKAEAKEKDEEKEKGKKEDDEEKRSSMTMFNLVFILHPRKNEVRDLVESLYTNIVKKVNKAFKYSQQHSDFVWKESKRILATKDRAREERKRMSELWKQLLTTSSLAASVHDIYEAVSQNKIATLHLDTPTGVLSPSVQIPAPFYVADIPPGEESRERGLWLTTANAFLSQDEMEEPGFLDKNFGLLLMEDEKKIVAELQADGDPATIPMVEFVRLSKPTMSFFQVGQSNILSLSQVRKYAQHFIFWRRAIAIPPLHARDTYIVSPNCDLTRLPEASAEWQRAFPLAPPLANFLSDISVCPRPYKTFCPSKIHRPLYLRMLAWLMRGGWVTQLCTFAYVVVWPEILYEVAYEMEAEELDGPTPSTSPHSAGGDSAISPTSLVPPPSRARMGSINTVAGGDDQLAPLSPTSTSSSVVSNTLTSTISGTSSSTGTHTQSGSHPHAHPIPVPTTAERTAEMARLERIAAKAHREAADKAAAHARKTPPQATTHPATNRAPHLAGLSPHIVMDAKKATGKESRYLSAIARRITDDKHRQAWQNMCKYFDGHCALERIALQEDMKRKEAWTLLTAMSEYLICTRHW